MFHGLFVSYKAVFCGRCRLKGSSMQVSFIWCVALLSALLFGKYCNLLYIVTEDFFALPFCILERRL